MIESEGGLLGSFELYLGCHHYDGPGTIILRYLLLVCCVAYLKGLSKHQASSLSTLMGFDSGLSRYTVGVFHCLPQGLACVKVMWQ